MPKVYHIYVDGNNLFFKVHRAISQSSFTIVVCNGCTDTSVAEQEVVTL